MKFKTQELIGKILHKLGFRYKTSTGIHDGLTYGYGKLDYNGFWQYPIYKVKNNDR